MAFLLGQRCDKSQAHVGICIERIDMFCFKHHADRRFHGPELADIADAVHDVSGKAGNAFCKDQVNFPLLAVLDHPKE